MGGWAFLASYLVVMVLTYVIYAAWFRVPVPHTSAVDPDLLYWSGLHVATFIPCWLLSAWASNRSSSPRTQALLGGGSALMIGATLIVVEVTS
jgi:hypothetical protein